MYIVVTVEKRFLAEMSRGGKVKTRQMSQADMEYSGHRKILCEFSKLSNFVMVVKSSAKKSSNLLIKIFEISGGTVANSGSAPLYFF